ncbi:MAG: T9SS C-terminal target domain-containing protein, partial [candidate division WOR-3 bacterium]
KMLENIRVVPNPFIVKADWDVVTPQGLVKHKVQFVNLPPECEIRIFTIDGDLVRTIKHSSGAGYADWDLTNEYGAFVAPGIYIYYVKSPWGEKTGRLGVIR